MKFKLFVSYSSHDLAQVELLKKQLGSTPIEVFVADDAIKPSETLTTSISEAISSCDLFVLLWSKNAQASEWVSQEIGKASAGNKQILPLVLSPALSLPGFIKELKHLPIFADQAAGLAKASEIIIAAYNQKADKLQLAETKKRQQKDKDTMAMMGIGAFLLWAFNK